ncbi:hypothetical protein AAHA92_09735 [Salvia divinorum]|uniref:Uncharacterized protein n=1 Tax=Salvia divinorum TaxID=28513 RepID=A0ABD1HSI4_SALDI
MVTTKLITTTISGIRSFRSTKMLSLCALNCGPFERLGSVYSGKIAHLTMGRKTLTKRPSVFVPNYSSETANLNDNSSGNSGKQVSTNKPSTLKCK